MTIANEAPTVLIRPVQYRDLENLNPLLERPVELGQYPTDLSLPEQLEQVRFWYGLIKFLQCFPNPLQHLFSGYVAEEVASGRLGGFVQIAPFNSSRSTWRVERVLLDSSAIQPDLVTDPKGLGSQLLRYCFERVWEARTWLLEVNIQAKNSLALYRQNGFQPLAQMTYWSLSPDRLALLANNDPDLPNLLPVSNADSFLLYQLDCVSMPPLLRQVFDRHGQDFKVRFLPSLVTRLQHRLHQRQEVSGYVFEPQRKAAIAYFKLIISKKGVRPHQAELTVHPAYTWLYPKLLVHMARLVHHLPEQSLELMSADYQHEREEYLEQLGAQRVEHTLLMSRSVWHKLKETKPERLQLSEVLQGLHPAPRSAIPSRMSLLNLALKAKPEETTGEVPDSRPPSDTLPKNGHHV
ncbi:GNAT family N-acetyltransferase [Synechocystis sp. LKSZ1]|uniref:GNAT family N-acetyltransferase n=1 Tax=Synechocystis sp. LKSZ1 TaxID=3144951 RepID=UPI00336C2558